MTQEHPITPPEGLVLSLRNSAPQGIRDAGATRELWLINQAYAAGADQELQECVNFVYDNMMCESNFYKDLRNHRRPKPLSLKEKALLQLDTLNADLAMHGMGCDLSQIRRAIESLPS